jgi:hypothetical protein
MNFKGVQTSWEKSDKFSIGLIFTKVNLVGHTCMQDFELQYKCKKAWFE